MRPVARAPPVMCHGKNLKLLGNDLIDDVIWESAQGISPASATKYSTKQRIGQNEIGRSFKLCHKRKAKRHVRFQRIERSGVVQFGERRW